MIFAIIYAMCGLGAAMAAHEALRDDPRVSRGLFWSGDSRGLFWSGEKPALWFAVLVVALLWPMALIYSVFSHLGEKEKNSQ